MKESFGCEHISLLGHSFGKKVREFNDFLAQLIVVQSYFNSGSTLTNVSPTTNSSISLLFFEDVFPGWYF